MLEAIKNFPRQFTYRPIIKNKKNYKKAKRFILLGMGGSHLAADLINNWEDTSNFILIHKNYGLPNIPDKELGQHLIIASSYSGNTEEVVDGLKKALQKKYKIIVIATGGKLIALAKKYKLPYIQMPATGIQPRSALGFSCRALLKAIGQPRALKETASLAQKLKPAKYQKRGQKIAKQLKNYLPVIYSSDRNISLAYNWKIKLNETGKIPAFYNVFPELNHNEMNGFDPVDQTKKLSRPFYFIFLQDDYDHTKVINRMAVLSKMYRQKGLPVQSIKLNGANKWLRIFSNLLLADWVAYYTALNYKTNPEQVPMVEKFKKLIK